MKKTAFMLSITLALFSIFSVFSAAAYTPTFKVYSNNVMLVNTDTNDVLFSKNTTDKIEPSSLTALMTAYVAVKKMTGYSQQITVSEGVISAILGTGAINSQLKEGEVVTVEQLLNLLLIQSSNDAALALAEGVSGSIDDFVKDMNSVAQMLGMKNTNFVTPYGLYKEGQYTTVEDLYILAKAFFDNETLRKISAKASYKMDATNKSSSRFVSTTNYAVSQYSGYFYKYCTGGKTGNSENQGRSFISSALKDGSSYICIVAGCKANTDSREDFNDTERLYKWAFGNFKYKCVVQKGASVSLKTSPKVDLSWDVDEFALVAKADVYALVPTDDDGSTIEYRNVQYVDKSDGSFDAPIVAGKTYGYADVYYADQKIGEVELVAVENISMSLTLLVWKYIKLIFFNPVVITLIVVAVAAFIILTVRLNVKNKKKRKKQLKLKKRF